MGRILTLMPLYRSGYIVGKFISVEKMISDSKQTYYDEVSGHQSGDRAARAG